MFGRNFFKDYLTFGKSSRIGLLSLMGLCILIYFLPIVFGKPTQPFPLSESNTLIKATNSLDSNSPDRMEKTDDMTGSYSFEPSHIKDFSKGELFAFDPNTLSEEGWQRLGLNERTIKTIHNYLSKGGKFYKEEDLKKIWGLPEGFYERVKDYISLVDQKTSSPNFQRNVDMQKSERKTIAVNINEADTSAYIALPGIGSKLAARIINFRDKLGGFYSVDQVGETYGLPDSTFQKIKSHLHLDNSSIKTINVNSATKDELKNHPYIKWNLANVIVEYRNQHGPFKSLEELKNISILDEAVFNRMVHYLKL